MSRPRISVCMVTGRRHQLLDDCLASLQRQEGAPAFELLVLSDGDPGVAGVVHARFPGARVGMVAKALPGAARNWLIEEAAGELLLFLDDDVVVEPHLLARLAEVADAHPGAGVFGGPNETPRGSSRFQFVQGAVLASLVGSGPVRRRYGQHPPGEADERFFTLCNLAVRGDVMRAFPDDLVCAEENAVLAELARAGVAMHYDPTLVAYHERRPRWRGFAQQMHKYGRGRGQLLMRNPHTFRLPFLAPSALVAYLAALPALALLSPWLTAPAALYGAVVAAGAAKVAWSVRGRLANLPLAVVLIVTLHVCYGTGVLRGIVGRRRPLPRHQAEWVVSPAQPSAPETP